MAATGYATTLRNAQLDAKTTFIGNAGLLRIYDGTRPANGAAVTTQVKLSEHTLGSPFASGAASGVLTPNLPSNVNALVNGTASWYRIVKADGTTFVEDGGVGTSAQPCIVNSTAFLSGVPVVVTSLVTTAGNAGI